MRVRIKFQKYGPMKFIGHLDVMRYFQKAFRRAKVDNEYTQGYSPHMIMSFAAPLGLGLTSDGEYMDIELRSSDTPEIMIERINSVLTEGFKITGFKILEEPKEGRKAATAMSLVSSADYMISLKDGYEDEIPFKTQEEFTNAFIDFISQDKILIEKKTKKSVKTVDIKSMLTLVAFDRNDYEEKLSSLLLDGSRISVTETESVADKYNNGIKVYLQVHTGSAANLKPELVKEAFCNYHNIPYQAFAWQVHRLEIYTREPKGDKLVALYNLD